MDLSNPMRAVAPSVESDVLAVLLRSHAPLTGARVAALAERSETQVRVVLRRLEEHGLVEAERHGQSYSYLLNREHVLVPGLEQIHQAMPTVEDRVRAVVQEWTLAPATLVLFGSAARRDGDAHSDIDLLLVRDDTTNTDDETWAEQRHALARDVERWTGNTVQIVDLSRSELAKAVRRKEPLISGLRADGILLAGRGQEFVETGAVVRGSEGRVEAITRADARTRLKTARMYLTAAELIVDETADEAATVATGNAVLAGIAAADAICADASGERYRGPDHRAAANHLERVTGDKALSRTLRELVDLKDTGHYGVSNVSRTNAKKALRRASRLIAEATSRVR